MSQILHSIWHSACPDETIVRDWNLKESIICAAVRDPKHLEGQHDHLPGSGVLVDQEELGGVIGFVNF